MTIHRSMRLFAAIFFLAALLLCPLSAFAGTHDVYDQATLDNALLDAETNITINISGSFAMTAQVSIPAGKTVTIQSDGGPWTIMRDVDGPLFTVPGTGSLTLSNAILDGNKANYSASNSGALVRNSGGTVNLEDGGGIALLDTFTSGSQLTLNGAVITGNYASTDGGGISALDSSPVRIEGDTAISGNTADGNGGGVNTDDLTKLDVGSGVVFSDNAASRAYDRNPADDPTYDAHIHTSSWTNPLPQGYNNYDIGYQGGEPLAIVNYESNGGSGVPKEAVLQGTAAAEPAPPVKPGYSFSGWFTDAGLSMPWDFGTPVDGNMTLYAGWTAVPASSVPATGDTSALPEWTAAFLFALSLAACCRKRRDNRKGVR